MIGCGISSPVTRRLDGITLWNARQGPRLPRGATIFARLTVCPFDPRRLDPRRLDAAAVIRGVTKGYSVETLFAHYSTKLMQGFLRHLQVCLPFYQRGGHSEFWETETAALKSGIAWMQSRLQNQAPPRYRLVGYELEPIAG